MNSHSPYVSVQFLGSASAVGPMSKIGQFFDHLNFGKYEPVTNMWGPFSGKISPKIRVCHIDPYPDIDFSTIPYHLQGLKEGWEIGGNLQVSAANPLTC